jgi:four helix bundle protein
VPACSAASRPSRLRRCPLRGQPGHRFRAQALRRRACRGGHGKVAVMALQVTEVGFEMVAAVRPVVARIRQRDRSLADQLVRAASSVVLNIAEAEGSDAGNRRARFYTAAGSANESLAALRLAVAWGYIDDRDAMAGSALLRRIVAMLWKLARR